VGSVVQLIQHNDLPLPGGSHVCLCVCVCVCARYGMLQVSLRKPNYASGAPNLCRTGQLEDSVSTTSCALFTTVFLTPTGQCI
jgi:hypothetical protein